MKPGKPPRGRSKNALRFNPAPQKSDPGPQLPAPAQPVQEDAFLARQTDAVSKIDFDPRTRAGFADGSLIALPITVDDGGGRTRQELIPVAPEELRMQVEAVRASVDDMQGRIAARLGDAPVAPERQMLRAHLESGYLAVWFENYARWHRGMREEFIAPTGQR